MNWDNVQQARLAIIADLVSKIPATYMGRTMLMKLCYFLQELRGVPLGYHFTIYSYGPFDSDVLADLGTAVNLEVVKSQVVYNAVGYGYQLEAGPNADLVKADAEDFLREHGQAIDWVIAEFGKKYASDLELESTTVFVDREASSSGRRLSFEELVEQVHNLKPHFKSEYIATRANDLATKQLLCSLS